MALALLAMFWRYYAAHQVAAGRTSQQALLGAGEHPDTPVGEVMATVIEVAGVPVVPVADRATAEAVISDIEAEYRSKLDPKAAVKDVSIREQVDFKEAPVQPGLVRTAEEARRILVRGTDKLLNYTVQRGDSLWQIATTHGLKVEDLSKANPGVNPGALQPGQEINLVVAEPYLHVQSVEEVTVVENIAFETVTVEDATLYPWQSVYDVQGVVGKREVTYLVRREDGRVVERQVKTQKVLSEPKQATYREGTKLAPLLGTGSFRLPVVGKLTSDYGWRGQEFHPGMDLAAPVGTPIYAADAGTVIHASWLGGYGLCVEIDHGQGKLVTLYGHMRASAVKVGQTVKQGDLIGFVGSTGRSTGPHVHFEVRRDGKAVNPHQFFPD